MPRLRLANSLLYAALAALFLSIGCATEEHADEEAANLADLEKAPVAPETFDSAINPAPVTDPAMANSPASEGSVAIDPSAPQLTVQQLIAGADTTYVDAFRATDLAVSGGHDRILRKTDGQFATEEDLNRLRAAIAALPQPQAGVPAQPAPNGVN